MTFDFTLEKFNGPLDLLLQMIERNQIDIMDIPIAEIADQFLIYIDSVSNDPETLSAFLPFLTLLFEIKSKMLLPLEEAGENNGENEEDPRLELAKKLLEYKMYKQLSEKLNRMYAKNFGAVYRKPSIRKYVRPEPINAADFFKDFSARDLYAAFQASLRRKQQRRDPARAGFGNIQRETVDVEKQKKHVTEFLNEHRETTFETLITENNYKEETVVDFLLILEMAKEGEIKLSQEAFSDPVRIQKESR